MMIRPATALRNNYDSMVKLSTEKQEPIYLTRNGEGEMVFLPIDLWEKRQAELELFAEMLRREQNKLAGSKTYSASEMQAETEDLLSESRMVDRSKSGIPSISAILQNRGWVTVCKKVCGHDTRFDQSACGISGDGRSKI